MQKIFNIMDNAIKELNEIGILPSMVLICVEVPPVSDWFNDLTYGNEYDVLGKRGDYYIIKDDRGEEWPYNAKYFEVLEGICPEEGENKKK